tara:strand:- start:901 stop:1203 length:303 start_codon:yes stop_codon:yes gene_type:complete
MTPEEKSKAQKTIDNNIKRQTYWHRIKDDLEYILKENYGQSLDPDLDRRFISDLIEYFDKRLMFIDDRMNENLPIYTSYARDTNRVIDLPDQYAKKEKTA